MNLKQLLRHIRWQAGYYRHLLSAARGVQQPAAAPSCAALEERILMSATPAAVVADAAQADPAAGTPESAEVTELAADEALAAFRNELQAAAQANGADSADTAQATLELVFVDEAVEDLDQLLADLQSQSDEARRFEVFRLEAAGDGVQQITELVSRFEKVDALHIVSHGADGSVKLGNLWLTADNLSGYAGDIAGWKNSLSSDADLLFYGCELAQTSTGEELLQSIAILTEADVAASDDNTGHEVLGGDWHLEFQVGRIESDVAVSHAVQQTWAGLLATSETHYFLTGSGIAQADLTTAIPTGASIPDYDSGRHAGAGTLIDKGGSGFTESDAVKHQRWQTGSGNINIDGPVRLNLWSHIKDFNTSKGATVHAYLIDVRNNGSDPQLVASDSVSRGTWNPAGDWVLDTFDFGTINRSLASNRRLQVKVVVDGSSDDGMVFGYDSIFHRSHLVVGMTTANGDPLLTSGGAASYTENDGAKEIGGALSLTDDDTNLQWATAQLTGNFSSSEDALSYLDVLPPGINMQVDAATGQIVFYGSSSVANYESVLKKVSYTNSSEDPSELTRTVTFEVYDGQNLSSVLQTINVAAVNDTPTVNPSASASGLEDQNLVYSQAQMLALIGAADLDHSSSELTVNITGVNNATFSKAGSGDGTTYTFTLTQPTHANGYSVTFNYEVVDPDLASASGGPATISIQAVNDEPGLTIGGDQNVDEDTGLHTVSGFASAAPGGGADESSQTLTYQVFNNNAALFDVAPAIDASGNLSYTLAADAIGSATVTVSVRDSGGTANGGDDTSGSQQFTINVANANNDDAYVAANAGLAIDENATKTITSGMLRVDDVDLPAASTLVYTVSAAPTLGRLELTSNPGVAVSSFTQEDINLNRLRYVHLGAEAPLTDSFDFTATDGIGSPTSVATFSITIDPRNDAPVNTVPGTQNTLVNTPLIFSGASGNQISIGDDDAGASQLEVTLTATSGTASVVLPFSTATPVGPENLIPSTAGQTQHQPAVARAANGDYVVVWSGKGPGDADGVYFQRYNASHVAQGAQTRVNTTTADSQDKPQVAMDDAGNFVVTWTSNLQDGDGRGVYARKFDSMGTAVTGEVLVNTYVVGGQYEPDIAMDADGDFVVVWQSNGQDGHSEGVYGQRFNSSVTKVGAEFQVSTVTAFKQYRPAVAMDADGDFVVVWEDSKADLGQPGIFVRRYDQTGTPRDVLPLRANSSSLKKQEFPDVAMDDAGNFVVVWTSQEQDTPTSRGIYGQLFDADGTKTGPGEFLVNTFVTGEQTDASVAMDADGDFVVSWESQNQDNPGDFLSGVYAQQFDSDAAKVGSELQVNTTVTGTQRTPQVALDEDGDFIVVWAGEGLGDADGVFARGYDLPPPPLTFLAGDGTADTTMTFRGTAADINAALDGLTFSPNTAFVGAASLQIVTDDLGNTGPGGPMTDDDTVVINVTAVNTDPVITSDGGGATAARNVISGTTSVTTVTATDSDLPAQTLSYSIVGGADALKFTINGVSGELDFLLPPLFAVPTDADLDNVYEVTVQVSDGAGGTDTQAISVTVLAGNTDPVITSDGGGASAALNVVENSTAVTTVAASDSDVPAQTLTYSISGGADAAKFAIDSASGALTFVAAPDFESPTDAGSDNVYNVTVQVSDGAGGTDSQNLSVTITDQNDNAPVVTSSQAFDVDEDAAVGTSLGSVTATDADTTGSLTNWAIVAGNTDGVFAIDGSTGELTVVDNANLDYELTNSYTLTVQVEDGVNVSATESVSVTINDRYEGVLVVDTTADVSDGDVSSAAALLANKGADGKISLREAIAAANNTTNGATPDEIHFNFADTDAGHVYYRDDGIADSLSNVVTTSLSDAAIADFDADYPYSQHSWFRIDVNSALPQLTITDAVVIDGYSQTGAAANGLASGQNAKLRVELTSSGSDNKYGLLLDTGADGSTVRGLAINGFDWTGLMIDYGVAGNTVAGSFIGTDITGTQAVANGDSGIQVRGNNNTIGGSAAGDRNVISGGNSRGVALFNSGTISGTVIRNNYIGVDATGNRALGNDSSGLQLYNSDGAVVRDNVISGNQNHGIWFRDGAALNTNNIIRGNIVGLGADGSTVIGNGQSGLMLEDASGNLIGGTTAAESNLISGNGDYGLLLNGAAVNSNTIYGNRIGTDTSGLLARGNGRAGISIDGGASANVVGGTTAGQGNIIAFNGQDGIEVRNNASDGNAIRGNAIHSNTGLGIDIDGSGVTSNDADDSDSGSNQEQNYPVLASATVSGADVTISGTISSTASTTLHIDFFASTTADGSGHGEAERYLGSATVATNGAGIATINTLLTGAGVAAGEHLTATATDSAGNTSEFSANIIAVAANLPPAITSNGGGANAAINVAENVTAVTTVTATDGDLPAQTLTYSISGGADAAKFAIDSASGALTFLAAPDFETPTDVGTDNVYDVQVQVSDGAGGTDTQDIAVTVTGTNDNIPVITSNGGAATAAVNVAENVTAVTTVTATDGDLPAQTLTYSISGGADAAKFAIDSSSGVLTFVSAPDFESPTDVGTDNVYDVQVQVSDGAGGTDTQDIAVTVTAVNDHSPVITSNGGGTSAAVNVAENSTAVTTVAATDGDLPAQTLTYSISGGADAAKFAINGSSGVLTFVAAPDFESPTDAGSDNVYDVQVQVSDGAGGTDTQNVAVTITDQNEFAISAVSDSDGDVNQISEVTSNGAAVGITAQAVDSDGTSNAVTYSLDNDAGGRFAIDGGSGVVTVKNAGLLDYEAATSHTITVRAISADGSFSVQNFSINILPVDDEAPVFTSPANVNLVENNPSVLTLTATDADVPASTVTFSIIGGDDAARFHITGADGLKLTAPPDYESPADNDGDNVYEVTLQASDGAGNVTVQNLSVTITDVNEAPAITSNGGGTSANVNVLDKTTFVTTVSASDPDLPAQTLTYSLAGGVDAAQFTIDAGSGSLSFVSVPNHAAPADADANNLYHVTVRVSDGAGGTDLQTLNITVLASNAAPAGSVTITGAPVQNATLTASHSLTDADGMGPVSWQWQRNGSDIAGAKSSTYTLTQADVGSHIQVVASYVDGGGTTESVTSSSVGPIANVNDTPSGSVSISGTPAEDQVLTASHTLTDADGMGAVAWQWLRDGAAIFGANGSSYLLTDADVGAKISVAASWIDGQGTSEQVVSGTVGPWDRLPM